MRLLDLGGAVGLLLITTGSLVDGPGRGVVEAVRVEARRPGEQLARLLAVCESRNVPNPAEALANWRAAVGRPDVLSKAAQAAIAAMNPGMVRELSTIDDSSFGLGFDPDGTARWSLAAPRDDGTLAAFATALALTGGGAEPPLRLGSVDTEADDRTESTLVDPSKNAVAEVDRLGGPGSLLMARSGPAVALAPDRPGLLDGLARADSAREKAVDGRGPLRIDPSGWAARLDVEALAVATDPRPRRVAAALQGLGIAEVQGFGGLLPGGVLEAEFASRLVEPTPTSPARLRPDALDSAPADGRLLAFAFALDAGDAPAGSDDLISRLFDAADAVERLDPDRAEAAPWRTRIGLLLLASGVRAESEVWPKLRGVSGWLASDSDRPGSIDPGLIALQASDEAAAERLADVVLPRLVRRFGPAIGADLGVKDRPTDPPTTVQGLPIWVGRRGPTVLVTWDRDVLDAAIARLGTPETSAGPGFRAAIGGRPVSRYVALWPGGLPRFRLPDPLPDRLAEALDDAPPAVWLGWRDGPIVRDLIRWDGLPETLAHLLRPTNP